MQIKYLQENFSKENKEKPHQHGTHMRMPFYFFFTVVSKEQFPPSAKAMIGWHVGKISACLGLIDEHWLDSDSKMLKKLSGVHGLHRNDTKNSLLPFFYIKSCGFVKTSQAFDNIMNTVNIHV